MLSAAAVVGEFFRSIYSLSESAERLPGSEPVVTTFARDFPDEIAAIYRAALKQAYPSDGVFRVFPDRRCDEEKALENLGDFGNSSDIPLLRAWSTHPTYGHLAIRVIKALEEDLPQRLTGPIS